MIEDLKNRNRNLELLLSLKKLIIREPDVDSLLSKVCDEISQISYYDIAWAVIIDPSTGSKIIYNSEKNRKVVSSLITKYECCFDDLNTSELYELAGASTECGICSMPKVNDATLLAKRIQYEGEDFGVFSVSVKNEFLTDLLRQQFIDLVEDLGFAIFIINFRAKHNAQKIKLAKNTEMYRSLLQESPVAICILDSKMKVTFASNRLIELLGYELSDKSLIESMYAYEFVADGFMDVARKNLSRIYDLEEDSENEYVFKRKNGENIHIRLLSSMIRDEDELKSGFVVVFNDLSEQKKTEDALQHSEEKFRNIFVEAPHGVLLLDPNGLVLDCNKKEAEFLHYTKVDLIGRNIIEFLEDSKSSYSQDFASKFLKERNIDTIQSLRRKDGKIIKVVRIARAVYHADGRIRNIIVHSRDITDYVEVQDKIKRLTQTIEQSPSIYTITDVEGDIIYVNRKFEEVTGYSQEEVIGVNPRILKSPEHTGDFYTDIWKSLKLGKSWKGEICNQKKNGELFWEYASMSVIRNDKGDIINFIKVAEDITVRKRAEGELDESRSRYQNVFSRVPSPIIIHINGLIVDANEAALDFSKLEEKERFLGMNIFDFVHDSSKKNIKRRLDKLNSEGGTVPISEERFVNKLGEVRTVNSSSSVVSFNNEKAHLVVFSDITNFKRAEKKIEESEKRLRNLFDIHPDHISITNLSTGIVIEVNEAFLRSVNLSRDQVVGVQVDDLNVYDDITDYKAIVELIDRDGIVLNHEVLMHIGGEELTLLVSGSFIEPIEDRNVLLVARDISERKVIENELMKSKEKAEEGDKLKASFLSNISHEIRTPMNAILGFSDLLRDPQIQQTQKEQYINIIQQRGNDLQKMISDIMDISKIESDSLEVVKRAVKVDALLIDLIEKAREKVLKDHQKEIDIVFDKNVEEEVLVVGDKYRIRQILNNLMDNAIKFTNSGSITVSHFIEGDKMVFCIEDTGCGIAETKKDFVFSRFVQVYDEDLSTGGFGLGLSISKSLVNIMGGDIWVKSELNVGTKFCFSLALYKGAPMGPNNKVLSDSSTRDWSKKTILIAEDEPSNQMFIKVILGKTKVNIIMANDGLEAVSLYKANRSTIDLVIVDVKMPEMNGYEVTKVIKAQDSDMKIIALTANAMNNDREEAISSGCDDYLTKPIAKELLYSTIEKFL